jgi:catechol 2,3-dioxygenase-like lactoylglutathione lyase family enzyme
MSHRGFSHIGLSTLDLDKTRDFYENVLKFKPVRCDILPVKEGGQIRHIFFDTGRDQLLAFMEARGVPGVPARYDAGINRGLGVPNAFYHFAFEAGSEAALDEKRNELIARGVDVSDVVDHDWAKSIYFKDPNGIQLEFCCFTRNLTANDARMQERAEVSLRRLGLEGAPTPAESAKVG